MSTSQHRQPRRLMRRLAGAMVNVLLLVATLAGVAYIAPSLLGFERYVITGGSMSGTFEKGSIAFEKRVPVEDLQVGDVITYQPPASSGVWTLVTHRIVSIKSLENGAVSYRTKGDANPDPDPWRFQLVEADQSVVQHTVPYVGWILVGLADREIRMLVIGVPAALIACCALAEIGGVVRTSRRRPADIVEVAPATSRVPVHA